MKKILISLCILSFSALAYAQDTGIVKGIITDHEYNNEPLAFATVILKGQDQQTETDLNGTFQLKDIQPGNYFLQMSFLGYQTVLNPIIVKEDEETEISISLKALQISQNEIDLSGDKKVGKTEERL
ncbi:MAG: carboxypeptidase-like regulatory domain-containing protein [Eudoraea sp.]|nr:carboxypeptidase-like regulatory domain-containing protein [Eudoraea sp.]